MENITTTFNKNVISSAKINQLTTPQKLTIKTWVEDQHPGHERVYSEQTFIVNLLSHAKKSEYDTARLGDLGKKIDDIIDRGQENIENLELLEMLLDQARRDTQSSDSKKAEEAKQRLQELTDQIDELKQKEADQETDIKEVDQELNDLFNEAAMDDTLSKKNPRTHQTDAK